MRKISIIMGIYNCAEYLPQAIDSILAQTYTDWELILCDDGSTDNTYDVADEYVQKYRQKIILIRHETNQFLSASLNDCLKQATGYYVARMDADDKSTPDRFEKQVKFLEDHPDIQLVGTAMQWFNEEGYLGIVLREHFPDRNSLRKGTPFNHATIMTYKEIYDKLGGYTVSERTRRGQDYDLWFRFYAAGYRGANIDDPLYLCREDFNTIKRRKFRGRWNDYKTVLFGFRLLNYPWYWYIMPTLALLKGLVPHQLLYLQRKLFKKASRH